MYHYRKCIAVILSAVIAISSSAILASQGGGQGGGQGQGHGGGQGHGQGVGQGQGHGKAKQAHGKSGKAKNWGQSKKAKGFAKNSHPAARFSTKDKTAITNYFKDHPFTTSPLPPGIAMNLARGKPLPPGIEKVFLPADALPLLPNYPGYEYLVAGKDVLLVNSTTQVVSDILSNILP